MEYPSRIPGLVLVTVLTLAATTVAAAQGGAKLPKCDSPEFRRFDYWQGDWDVTSGGQPAGHNLVTLEEEGCVIHEHWKGARGGTGQSFTFYDRRDGKWHQMWVSNSGNALYLTGDFDGTTLTLEGTTPQADGTRLLNRLSFHHNPDSTVRQYWETSPDDGKTWSAAFDGLYRRRQG
ncbi:MAG TPA: hypothetical protein VIG08_03285 [Gemmatimonadales bacterium]|jgi:hypothetical protein